MYKPRAVLFIPFLVWVCMFPCLYGQISASQTSGCAPLQVTFSSPAGSTAWSWNFGNTQTAQTASPSCVYNTPGTYMVTYSGTGGNPTSGSIQITVLPNTLNPTIGSTVAASHCAPMLVNFTGNSNGGNVYQWTFGDGGVGSGSNVNYSYPLGGIFTATLVVSNTLTGCSAATTAGPFSVSTLPNIIIGANPGFNSCTAPFAPAFTGTNSTSGSPIPGGGLTYTWNFGGGQPGASNSGNPGTVNFANPGYYNITLSVTDNNSCTNSKTAVVSAIQPTVSAAIPPTVCIYGQQPYSPPVFIYTVQASTPNTTWNMGDGNTIIVPPPPQFLSSPTAIYSHTYALYTTPGLKTLTITATEGNCVASITRTIMVEEITPEFTATAPAFTCSPSMPATYINQSTVNTSNPLSYSWTVAHWNNQLGSAIGSTAVNPTFTLTQGSPNPYTYHGVYAPKVRLLVTSAPLGCRTSIIHVFDSIRRPTAWFSKSGSQGCAPLKLVFRDSSNTNPTIFPIQSYTWNNGASPPLLQVISGTSPPAIPNPTFVYSSPGTYTPFLTINTSGGCSDVSYIDTVIVVTQPTVSLVTPDFSICAGQPVQLHLTAAPSSTDIQHWHINSDAGFFSGCVSDSMPSFIFTHVGSHNFTVSASNHGCTSTLVPTQTVTVKGPLVKGIFKTNCVNKKVVDFDFYLADASYATVNFGDVIPPVLYTVTGTPGANISSSLTHTFPASGDFSVILTGYNTINNCGIFIDTMIVRVRDSRASFSVDPITCASGLTTFTASPTDVSVGGGRGFTWFIDNGPPAQTSNSLYAAIIDQPGTHTVTLLIKDVNSCTDTTTRIFIIDSPTPSFSFASNPACLSSMPLQIINTTPQTPVATNSFTWNLGIIPATAQSTPVANSVTFSPVFSYTAPVPSRTYTVTLMAQSQLYGCITTASMVLQVNNPQDTYIYPYPLGSCIGQAVSFSVPEFTNSIIFGDGSPPVINTASTLPHTYTASGTYTPIIIYTDSAGCSSTASATVDVQDYPVADFIFSDNDPVSPNTSSIQCKPTIQFTSTTVSNFSIANYGWNFTGVPAISDSIVGWSFNPGVHSVTLTASTSNGCSSTIVKQLAVLIPTATIQSDKTNLCLGDVIKLKITDSTNVASWKWFFGDGNFEGPFVAGSTPAPTPTVSHSYQFYPGNNGATQVNLVYYSAGNTCTRTAVLNVQITKVDADFKRNAELARNDSVHCLNLEDFFSNVSKINNSPLINGLYFNWDFGNGVTSTSMSPSYTYPTPGVYTVTLSVNDPLAGCVDVTVKNMTINPLPTVSISVPDSICSGSSFLLSSSASTDVAQYQWKPATGVSNPQAANTSVTATVSTTYSLDVMSVFGCTASSAGEYVYIQQPAPVIQWDTTIIVGQSTVLNSNIGPNFTYTWSPLKDLNCEHCPYPTSTSTTNITYSVTVEDNMKCFRVINTYSVMIDPRTSVDVPTAFTPNGDGVNDVIYVDGWGIKKLNYFRIYNRWGQLLFESTDIKNGWDGTFRGVPQNMETYVYQVSAEGYLANTLFEKTATFRLIR